MTYNHNISEYRAAMAKQIREYNADVAACRQPVTTWESDFRLGRNIGAPGRGI